MRRSRLGDAFAYSAAMGALEGRWREAFCLLADMCFGRVRLRIWDFVRRDLKMALICCNITAISHTFLLCRFIRIHIFRIFRYGDSIKWLNFALFLECFTVVAISLRYADEVQPDVVCMSALLSSCETLDDKEATVMFVCEVRPSKSRMHERHLSGVQFKSLEIYRFRFLEYCSIFLVDKVCLDSRSSLYWIYWWLVVTGAIKEGQRNASCFELDDIDASSAVWVGHHQLQCSEDGRQMTTWWYHDTAGNKLNLCSDKFDVWQLSFTWAAVQAVISACEKSADWPWALEILEQRPRWRNWNDVIAPWIAPWIAI